MKTIYYNYSTMNKKRIILIDFENIQKIDFERIDTTNTELIIFVGKSQNKVPFQLVEKTQKLGNLVRWFKIAGDGKNNLDFHIAFEIGRLSEREKEDVEFVILSKDSGFDSLVKYINDSGIITRRIGNLAELNENKKELPASKFTSYVVANLKKIDNPKRPRTRSTLRKHMESILRDRAQDYEIDLIIEEMFVNGLLTQTGNRLKYNIGQPSEEH